MDKNRKIILFALIVLAVIVVLIPACQKKKLGPGTPVVVTDEAGEPVTNKKGEYVTEIIYKEVVVVTDRNGVPVTDESGEAITVVLKTEIVPVTNAQGEKIYDENGEEKTSIVYYPQEIESIPASHCWFVSHLPDSSTRVSTAAPPVVLPAFCSGPKG